MIGNTAVFENRLQRARAVEKMVHARRVPCVLDQKLAVRAVEAHKRGGRSAGVIHDGAFGAHARLYRKERRL